VDPHAKSRLVTGLLGILLPFGIHRFYLGFTKMGVIQLVVTVITCGIGALWPFIEGILYLVGPTDTPPTRRDVRSRTDLPHGRSLHGRADRGARCIRRRRRALMASVPTEEKT
jgi:hypothetical protein